MAQALYAYAVVGAGRRAPPVEAILPGAGFLALEEGGIAAVASRVERTPFEAGPGCRTDDPTWLAERAAAHHGVVAGLGGAVLPLAFGAMFTDEAPLRAWLRDRGPRLSAALAAVAGHSEWSLGLDEDSALHEAWLRERNPALAAQAAQAASAGAGTAFLLGRRLERAVVAARLARRQEVALTIGARIGALVAHASACAPRAEIGVAAWSLLLRDAGVPALRAALEDAAAELADSGLALRLSGPWPPYAFARMAVADA